MKAAGAAATFILAYGSVFGISGVTRAVASAASASAWKPKAEELCPEPPKHERRGYARLRCDMRDDGGLENCVVLGESPKGRGVGRAALNLAKLLKMPTQTRDGRPAPKIVIVPVSLTLPDKPVTVPKSCIQPLTPAPAHLRNAVAAAPVTDARAAVRSSRG